MFYRARKKLFKISSYSKKVLEQILEEETDIKFDYKKQGILHFYRNAIKFELAIILHQTKQWVTKITSAGRCYALLDIVCFDEMKGEKKQGDDGAFQDLAGALSGPHQAGYADTAGL
jgi:hypothetical protein